MSEPPSSNRFDAIVIGGGAAGLLCAITAGERGRRVLVIEHANRVGKKILMSGGGRCNFTHLAATPAQYLSGNPHFCKSALARYTPWDFLARVDRHRIPWHEKTPGQLFCDRSSKDIVAMLLADAQAAAVQIRTGCRVHTVVRGSRYQVGTDQGCFESDSLVIATGGLSIPKMGATDFGHRIARQFALPLRPLRAGLVPFTLHPPVLAHWAELSGVSAAVHVEVDAEDGQERPGFSEQMLVTHRGLSGPAMLQLSSYWPDGAAISVNWMPGESAEDWLAAQRSDHPRRSLRTVLSDRLSQRLAVRLCEQLDELGIPTAQSLAQLTREQMDGITDCLQSTRFRPSGTEGYRTAEVTLGGVDTQALSSKTMEARAVPGLFFIGEVVDVTGWLGGYNFQWAWASGWAAAQAL